MFNFVVSDKSVCVDCETEQEQFFLQLEGVVEFCAHPFIFVVMH